MHVLDDKPVWLLGPNSLWAIIILSVWRALPFAILIFLAGLQAVPDELYEAASIDGANAWQRFRRITLPLMKPLIAIQLLFGVIYSVYQFAIPYVMMGTNPGPYADLLMTLVAAGVHEQPVRLRRRDLHAADVRDARVAVWYLSFRRSLEPQT